MMRRHYRSRRSRRSSGAFRSFLPSVMLVVVGAAGFYGALQWFRSDAASTSAAELESATEAVSTAQIEEIAVPVPEEAPPQAQVATVPLRSRYDGQNTGKVDRYAVTQGFEYYVLAYLPALDTSVETYHVWLLKDGLADVRDMGPMTARADGSWVGHVVADTIHGISDASAYGTVVIMRQTVDAGASTLGSKIAEAKF